MRATEVGIAICSRDIFEGALKIAAIDVARIVLILDILKTEPTWLTNSLDINSERNHKSIWYQSSCSQGHEDMMWVTMKYLFGLVNELDVIKVLFLEGKTEKLVTGELDIWIWGYRGNMVTGNKMYSENVRVYFFFLFVKIGKTVWGRGWRRRISSFHHAKFALPITNARGDVQ